MASNGGKQPAQAPSSETVTFIDKDLPSFRISYQPRAKGRANVIRLAATLGGIGFEDEFIPFAENKKRQGLTPHMTIIDIDGKDLVTLNEPQSQLRYVGRMAGLYGDSALTKALIDQVVDHAYDMIEEIAQALRTETKDDDEFVMSQRVPYWLGILENKLAENEKRGNAEGFVVGNTVTIGDLAAYQAELFLSEDRIKGGAQLLKDKQRLSQHLAKMDAHETIVAFYERIRKDKAAYMENNDKNTFRRSGKFCPGKF